MLPQTIRSEIPTIVIPAPIAFPPACAMRALCHLASRTDCRAFDTFVYLVIGTGVTLALPKGDALAAKVFLAARTIRAGYMLGFGNGFGRGAEAIVANVVQAEITRESIGGGDVTKETELSRVNIKKVIVSPHEIFEPIAWTLFPFLGELNVFQSRMLAPSKDTIQNGKDRRFGNVTFR